MLLMKNSFSPNRTRQYSCFLRNFSYLLDSQLMDIFVFSSLNIWCINDYKSSNKSKKLKKSKDHKASSKLEKQVFQQDSEDEG